MTDSIAGSSWPSRTTNRRGWDRTRTYSSISRSSASMQPSRTHSHTKRSPESPLRGRSYSTASFIRRASASFAVIRRSRGSATRRSSHLCLRMATAGDRGAFGSYAGSIIRRARDDRDRPDLHEDIERSPARRDWVLQLRGHRGQLGARPEEGALLRHRLLLRRRLPRKAHDFEGLSLRPILADLDDLAVAHGVDLGLWNLHRLLAAVWPPAGGHGHDDAVTGI